MVVFMLASTTKAKRSVLSRSFQDPKVKNIENLVDDDEYAKKALLSEISVMKSVDSPNIVRFIDTVESNKNYYIVQELC